MTRTFQPADPAEARYAAYQILQRVDRGGYADRLLDHHLRRQAAMDVRERGLLTELVYGVLRLRGRLDFALSRFSRQPLERLEPGAQLLLRIGAYQLLELDRIPAHAAVHATVELAHQVGMDRVAGLVNGTLRALDRERSVIDWPTPDQPRAYLRHVCSLPNWLAGELLRQFPNVESRALAEALALPAPLTLRTNTMQISRADLLAALTEAGHEARTCRYAPEGVVVTRRGAHPLPGDRDGWYQVQDEASMLMAHLLDARPGQAILDVCAAPGGKTTHLAALTGNQARITAIDKHPQRVALIERGAARLGCQGIETHCWDFTQVPEFLAPGSFDRVLVDAPCSGLGVLRRNPESRWNRKPADLEQLAGVQSKILDRVVPLLRPGGRLLYSVCTFTTVETEAVVEGFLSRYPEFVREDFGAALPSAWSELLTETGSFRSLPHRHDGMDAFFAVRFVKT